MVRTKRAKPDRIWWVTHPDHTITVVSAPNWEQATVEAARFWDVPWRKVAALCECHKTAEVNRNVCVNCGVIFHGEGPLCTKCGLIARDKEMNRRARERRYYQKMMPRADGRKEAKA